MKYKYLLPNFFKKPIFSQIVLLMLLMGIIYFFKLPFNLSRNNTNTSNLASLFINFEKEKRFFEGDVVKDMTVLDALNAAVSVGNIKFNYAIDESGNVYVLEIDGHINKIDNKYFVFYINSKRVATKDLNKEIVHAGDSIEIRNE